MAKYAVLIDDVVSNIIVADTKEIAEEVTGSICIEYTDENPVGKGDNWNGSEFTKPIVEEITND
jgi:hypothetical protein